MSNGFGPQNPRRRDPRLPVGILDPDPPPENGWTSFQGVPHRYPRGDEPLELTLEYGAEPQPPPDPPTRGLLDAPPPGLPQNPPVPQSLLDSAAQWGEDYGHMTSTQLQKEMNRRRAMLGDSAQASIRPQTSKIDFALEHMRNIPRKVGGALGSALKGGFYGAGSGMLRIGQALTPGENPRMAQMEQWGLEQIPESDPTDPRLSPLRRTTIGGIGKYAGLLGSLAPEFNVAADVADLFRIPGYWGSGIKPEHPGRVALSLIAAVPGIGIPAGALLKKQRGLAAMSRSRLEGAIADSPQLKATGAQWQGQIRKAPGGVAKGEMEWTGIQGLLGDNPERVFTRDELLQYLDERGVKLKETWRTEDYEDLKPEMVYEDIQDAMNQESQFLGPEVRRVLQEDPGPDGHELVLSNDYDAYDELMEDFPELMENDDWAETVLRDVFPALGRRIFGDSYNYSELDELIRRGWRTDRFVAEAETAERLGQQALNAGGDAVAHEHFGRSWFMNRGAEYAATVEDTSLPARVAKTYPQPTKFEEHRIEGPSKNYRELTIQLDDPLRRELSQLADAQKEIERSINVPGEWTRGSVPQHLWPPEAKAEWDAIGQAIARFKGEPSGGGFKGGHFREPNVLVHLRMSDRTHTNPKTGSEEKVLFLEEIQSDWHQKGRKGGYHSGPARAVKNKELSAERRGRGWGDDVYDVYDSDGGYLQDVVADSEESALSGATASRSGAVPDAPFKPTGEWTELAMRRAIQEAVDGGYDRVAWASGEQVSDLYDLRKHVDEVSYNEATGTLEAWASDMNRPIINEAGIIPEKLPDYIGKEPAQRLMDAPTGGDYVIIEKKNATTGKPFFLIESPDYGPDDVRNVSTTRNTREAAEEVAKEYSQTRFIEGEDLAVGGEGMIGYYDRILPRTATKYGKQVGGIEIEGITLRGIKEGAEDLTVAQLRQGARELDLYGEPIVRDWLEVMDVDGGTSTDAMQGFSAVERRILLGYEDDILGHLKLEDTTKHPLGTNSSFQVTPEMRRIVGEGNQRLWGVGGIGLLGASAATRQRDDEPDQNNGLLAPTRR
jgi:hypothetical protein